MFQGAITAMVTPFHDGSVDYEALAQLVDIQLGAGINGLLLLGTTAETPTLSRQEKKNIVTETVVLVAKETPIIVGTGSNNTSIAIADTEAAAEWGADAALVVTPYYSKPTQTGILRHFTAVADNSPIPIILYNIKGRTGVNIETATLKELSAHSNIVGVKEASGDMSQIMDVIAETGKDFSVLSGDDALTLPLIALGGNGVISVVSNLVPEDVTAMVNVALSGDFKRAVKKHYYLLPLIRAMFLETNPIPVKTALAVKGLIYEVFRLPMCPMKKETRAKLVEAVSTFT